MKLLLLFAALLSAAQYNAAPQYEYNDYEFSEEMGKSVESGVSFFKLEPGVEVPESINWVKKGAVTGVKDQKSCGSCYAFSAVGALEGLLFLKNKTLTNLSEQEIVDCSMKFGNNGCFGGLMRYCYNYVKERPGIDSYTSYPYVGTEQFCEAEQGNVAAYCTGYKLIEQGDEEALRQAVGTVGPVAVAVAVSYEFLFYKGGIYNGTCGTRLNHGVLVVGYDSENGTDYWLVKNSWGESWGEHGYIRMIRNVNKCGIASDATFPVYDES